MDKTITANFNSVDEATFAVKNVTSHFGGIRKVKVTYDKKSGHETDWSDEALLIPGFFAAPYGGAGMSSGIGMDGMTSGVYPLAYTMALEEWNERDRTALEGKKAKVSITAPENLAGQIQSTLYSGGGLEIQVS